MGYKTPLIIVTATAGALLLPLVLVAVLPVLRSPTTGPPWNPEKLPPGVTRSFTPSGLELLAAKPLEESSGGGSGIQELVAILRQLRSQRIFNVSERAWSFATTVKLYPEDSYRFRSRCRRNSGLHFNTHPDQPSPSLVGHPAGGLVQVTLDQSQKEILTSSMILVAAIPPTGGFSVVINWLLADPWYVARMIRQGGDPKPPLDLRGCREGCQKDVIVTPKVMKKAAEQYQAPLAILPDAGHHLLRGEVWKDAADVALVQLKAWAL